MTITLLQELNHRLTLLHREANKIDEYLKTKKPVDDKTYCLEDFLEVMKDVVQVQTVIKFTKLYNKKHGII